MAGKRKRKERTEVSEEAQTLTLRVIAIGLLLFGALQAYGSYRNVVRSRAAEDWPSVRGVVTLSMRGRQRTSLKRFAYEYQVEGALFESGRVGFAYRPFYRAVRQYTVGDSLTVRTLARKGWRSARGRDYLGRTPCTALPSGGLP